MGTGLYRIIYDRCLRIETRNLEGCQTLIDRLSGKVLPLLQVGMPAGLRQLERLRAKGGVIILYGAPFLSAHLSQIANDILNIIV